MEYDYQWRKILVIGSNLKELFEISYCLYVIGVSTGGGGGFQGLRPPTIFLSPTWRNLTFPPPPYQASPQPWFESY